jgi:hypothetical protein
MSSLYFLGLLLLPPPSFLRPDLSKLIHISELKNNTKIITIGETMRLNGRNKGGGGGERGKGREGEGERRKGEKEKGERGMCKSEIIGFAYSYML